MSLIAGRSQLVTPNAMKSEAHRGPQKTPNSCSWGHSHFVISEIAPEEPTWHEVQLFFACATGGRGVPGACVDRSVIQRAHTVSIMDPCAVCVRSGRGDTGGLPNKNTCCKQEAAERGKRELRVRVSNAFFFFSLPVNHMQLSVSESGCLFLCTGIKFGLPQLYSRLQTLASSVCECYDNMMQIIALWIGQLRGCTASCSVFDLRMLLIEKSVDSQEK